MSKKSIICLAISLILILLQTSSALAYSKSFSGTRGPYVFVDSDFIYWYISYDYSTYEYWTYSSATNQNIISKHYNDGTLNNAKYIPLDQTMDNSSSYQKKASSTSTTYTEIGRINYYDWYSQSVLIPAGDIYFPGYRNNLTYSITKGLGKVYYFWWLYVTEGWWGAARSFTAYQQFTL